MTEMIEEDRVPEWGENEGAPRYSPENPWYFEDRFSANDCIAFMNWMFDRIARKKGDINYPTTMNWFRSRDSTKKRQN